MVFLVGEGNERAAATAAAKRGVGCAGEIGMGHPQGINLAVGEGVFYLGRQAGSGGSILQSINQFAAIRAKS